VRLRKIAIMSVNDDIHVKFHEQIDYQKALSKKHKITSNGVVKGSRELILEFWDRPYLGNG